MLSSSIFLCFFFFKQKTAYEMRISDWSSDVCSSDLHLLAGSAWIGALAAFILMLSRRSPVFDQFDTAHRALAGFATAGTVIVGLVIVTGIVNSYALIGPQNMSGLFQSAYGQLLLIKLVLFEIGRAHV